MSVSFTQFVTHPSVACSNRYYRQAGSMFSLAEIAHRRAALEHRCYGMKASAGDR